VYDYKQKKSIIRNHISTIRMIQLCMVNGMTMFIYATWSFESTSKDTRFGTP